MVTKVTEETFENEVLKSELPAWSRTSTVPDPIMLFRIWSRVPSIVETMAMMAAIPIIIPSIVRTDRSL